MLPNTSPPAWLIADILALVPLAFPIYSAGPDVAFAATSITILPAAGPSDAICKSVAWIPGVWFAPIKSLSLRKPSPNEPVEVAEPLIFTLAFVNSKLPEESRAIVVLLTAVVPPVKKLKPPSPPAAPDQWIIPALSVPWYS